jgi:hypothetical protein
MMEFDIEEIRKLAAHERGRRAFEGEPVEVPLQARAAFSKVASVEDPQLLSIAARLGGNMFEHYEALGGRYKTSR